MRTARAASPGALVVVALLIAAAACGDGGGEHVVPQGSEPTAEPAWNPEVRRPVWRFVFERTGERCVVRRIDGNERVTDGEEAACPVDMRVGERIRLAGSVCLRESDEAARARPVVCPDPLTNAEKEWLQEKGLLPEED